MTGRKEQLSSLSKIIEDYRQDEISPRSPELIDDWLQQFPREVQGPVLGALLHILEKTYISKEVFRSFLASLASTDKLSPGSPPAGFWSRANLLNIQQAGNSQREILDVFDEILRETHGIGVSQIGSQDGDFIYIDDCIATGSRLRSDICHWLQWEAPEKVILHVITPALFRGSWWVDAKIQEAAKDAGKSISLKKWRIPHLLMENRLSKRNQSDVLWPTSELDDDAVKQYVAYLTELGRPPTWRNQSVLSTSKVFNDAHERMLLENEFLKIGARIRNDQPNLPEKMRPLGYSNLDTLGFGSMFLTYRNCPNNCPLVFWIEQEDFPALFPRKSNTDVSDGEVFF